MAALLISSCGYRYDRKLFVLAYCSFVRKRCKTDRFPSGVSDRSNFKSNKLTFQRQTHLDKVKIQIFG